MRITLPIRVAWTVFISTTYRLGLSFINLPKALKVIPTLSVDSLIEGIVDLFISKSMFLAVQTFLSNHQSFLTQ